jgi:hypothetical protein
MSALVTWDVLSIATSDNCFREETLQDVPDVEIESNWDQVVDKYIHQPSYR